MVVAIWTTEGAARSWIGRLDSAASVQWAREFRAGVPTTKAVDRGFVITDGAILVRSTENNIVVVRSLALSDGHQLWERAVETLHPGEDDHDPQFDLWEVGHTVLLETRTSLFFLSTADGTVRNTVSTAHVQRAPRVSSAHVVLTFVDKIVAVSTATGASSTLQGSNPGCVDGEDYLQIVGDTLIARRLDDLQDVRTVAELPREADTVIGLHACGRFAGNRVLETTTIDRSLSSTTQIRVLGANDRFQTIDIGSDQRWVVRDGSRREDITGVSGELPRFLLYPVVPSNETGHEHLVMIDLAEGKIAWRRPSSHTIINLSIFRNATDWIVAPLGNDPIVEVFDGQTGESVSNAELPVTKVDLLEPEDIANGTIWLAETEWTDARFKILRFDSHTLRRIP